MTRNTVSGRQQHVIVLRMIAPLRKHTIIILSLVTVLFFVCNACGGGGVSSGGFGGGGNGGNSSPTISTFAGNGTSGYTGDGGLATAATINGPYGVSVDVHGNVYITDTGNSVVRKVDTTGKITTIAGNGSQGFSGDGGPAISASLYAPLRAVADSAGNVYIADSFNNRIRKVDSSGKISTFAGLGTQNFSGDGGQANAAELNLPGAIAVDSTGNVFICDTWNHRIRKVDSSGVITTVVGTGFPGVLGDGGQAAAAQLNEPEDVAVDSHGNIYIADTANSKIRKVDTSGVISTIAGNSNFGYGGDNGPGPSATLNEPTGVTVASSGNVYVADFLNNRIRKISTSGTITTFAGNGTSGFSGDGGAPASATISLPKEVAVDASESLYIADSNNMRIRRVH